MAMISLFPKNTHPSTARITKQIATILIRTHISHILKKQHGVKMIDEKSAISYFLVTFILVNILLCSESACFVTYFESLFADNSKADLVSCLSFSLVENSLLKHIKFLKLCGHCFDPIQRSEISTLKLTIF